MVAKLEEMLDGLRRRFEDFGGEIGCGRDVAAKDAGGVREQLGGAAVGEVAALKDVELHGPLPCDRQKRFDDERARLFQQRFRPSQCARLCALRADLIAAADPEWMLCDPSAAEGIGRCMQLVGGGDDAGAGQRDAELLLDAMARALVVRIAHDAGRGPPGRCFTCQSAGLGRVPPRDDLVGVRTLVDREGVFESGSEAENVAPALALVADGSGREAAGEFVFEGEVRDQRTPDHAS